MHEAAPGARTDDSPLRTPSDRPRVGDPAPRPKHAKRGACLAGWLVIAGVQGGPVATLHDLGPALTACFRAPPHSAGSQLTVLLSLTRDGAILGKPRITYSHLVGPPEDQLAFAQAVLASLDACTPLRLTPGMGGAIAGRPLSLRFVGGGPAQAI